jgi:Fur family transcriptional regulator, ferric uptake regulator
MPRPSVRSKGATSGERESGAALPGWKGSLRAFEKEKGLHSSKIRDLVVDTFLTTRDHTGLEDLLQKVRAKNPNVGMATVYRTMKLLEQAGLADARNFGSGSTVYEVALGRDHHDHLVCERCGAIVEFFSEPIEKLQDKIASEHGFELRRHRHELFGLCRTCQRRR